MVRMETCCAPGDITVTRTPHGFIIGRALPVLGPGPHWEFVTIVSAHEEAVEKALALARETGSRGWWHGGADGYQPLRTME
jgi:hypothetical protein